MFRVPVGIDLDNTIIDYAAAFAVGATRLGFAAGGKEKRDIRDALRAQPGGEQRWRELQAYAYGEGIAAARPFPGVPEFFERARDAKVPLRVISHKSRFAAARPDVDLRVHAQSWLDAQPFARGVPVAFAETRSEKLALIATSGVAVFVDDLIEVLADPGFPDSVERWWFTPQGGDGHHPHARRFRTWNEIAEAVFGD